MKDIFTYAIALILFGLCLVEKELRRQALESAAANENNIEHPQTSANLSATESPLIKHSRITADNSETNGVVADGRDFLLYIKEASFHTRVMIE